MADGLNQVGAATNSEIPRAQLSKRVLHLTIKRHWFDEIALDRKPFEFRDIKPHWEKRLRGREYDEIHIRNGYDLGKPFMRVAWNGWHWGEWEGRRVFAIDVRKKLEIRNWDGPVEWGNA